MPGTLSVVSTAQQINWTQTVFGNSISLPIQFGSQQQLTVGTVGTANAFQATYAGTRNVVSGTPDVLNLTATLIQPDGTTATFTDLVVVAISCPTSNTDYITLGGGTDPVAYFATNQVVIYPGSTFSFVYPVANALAITASTADRLTVTSHSGTQTYNILLVGH